VDGEEIEAGPRADSSFGVREKGGDKPGWFWKVSGHAEAAGEIRPDPAVRSGAACVVSCRSGYRLVLPGFGRSGGNPELLQVSCGNPGQVLFTGSPGRAACWGGAAGVPLAAGQATELVGGRCLGRPAGRPVWLKPHRDARHNP